MKNIILQVVFFSFLGMSVGAQAVDSLAPFSLPLLPYEKTALEPYISERTLT